jgi:RND superfamily putative drug exporter
VFRLLAWLVVRFRFLVLAASIAGAAAATIWLPSIGEAQGSPLGELVADDAAALETEVRAARHFEIPLLSRTAVVQRNASGLSLGAQERALTRAFDLLRQPDPALSGISFALPVLNTGELFPSSRENGTTAITFLYFASDQSLGQQRDLARRYAEEAKQDSFVGVTGSGPARVAEAEQIRSALPIVEAVTVALIAVIIGLMYRSVGAPLLALAAAGISYLVSVRVVAWVGLQLGISVPQEVEPIIVVLLLGITTDYAIFYLSGFHRRLVSGEPKVTAAEATARRYSPIVFTAGAIVCLGAATLLAGRLDVFRAFGPGLAVSVLVTLLVALTFVPASLAILGRAVFWPRLRESELDDEERTSPWRERLAHKATGRLAAIVLVLLATTVLVAGASGLRKTELGFTLISGLPGDSAQREAAAAASEGFAPGILSPAAILVEGQGLSQQREALVRLEELLAQQTGVAGVVGLRDLPPELDLPVFLAEDGEAARFAVILVDDPLSAPAIDDLERLEAEMPDLLTRAGLDGARFGIAGDTALAHETVSSILSDLKRIAIAVLLVNVVFLAVFLRSLVAPLYLVAASVLALAATLGVTTYVFQDLLGNTELSYYVPFAVAVLLISLGSDYSVFVTGRIWQEARRRPLRDAIAYAVPRASRTITIAGIALALSFATLAIVPLRAFRELAFALSIGVLIDTFLVRSVLVPALVSLVGHKSFWPSRRYVEPPEPVPEAVPESAVPSSPPPALTPSGAEQSKRGFRFP